MKLTDDQVAGLNLRLQQLGFATMGDYARALTDGIVGNEQLVGTLADSIADRIVVKMTTNPAQGELPLALERMKSHGWDSIPRPPAYKAGALPG
jgi:hypothetical protein